MKGPELWDDCRTCGTAVVEHAGRRRRGRCIKKMWLAGLTPKDISVLFRQAADELDKAKTDASSDRYYGVAAS